MKRRSFASLFVVVVAISLILSGCFGGGSGGDSTPYAASGRITDAQGNGVSGITVSFSGGTSSSTTTDAEGKWQASLKGTVKVEPWGYQFEPPSKTVTASSSKADFVLVGNIETVIEQITVEIGASDETISSQNYDDAPQVIIPSGTLPQGTEVTYQVLDGMSIHPDSPLSVLGLPIKLEFNNDTVSSFGQGNSSGIITIRGKLNGQEELYTIGIFNGEFWDVHTPTIKDGLWELEIDADRFQTSDMESLGVWDGMKNSVVAFGKWAISNENHNPDLQLYKYQHGNWVKQVNFHHDDARDDVVLLVHGFFSDHTVWDSLASYYSQKFPNVKLYSISYESGFPLESYGTQLVFLLDRGAMEGVKVNIVAHSMGGLVSRSAIQPKMGVDNVKALVTLGTPHEGVDKKVFSSLTVDASYDLNWWQEILAKIDRAVINGTTTGLRAFYKWTAGPEVRDLEPNSTFLRDLNARRRSSIDMHYFAGGSNASYHLASKTGGFYGPEPNDGLVSVDSALLISETEMTIQRYLIPRLNHQTLHEDEDVFDKIGEILGFTQQPPSTPWPPSQNTKKTFDASWGIAGITNAGRVLVANQGKPFLWDSEHNIWRDYNVYQLEGMSNAVEVEVRSYHGSFGSISVLRDDNSWWSTDSMNRNPQWVQKSTNIRRIRGYFAISTKNELFRDDWSAGITKLMDGVADVTWDGFFALKTDGSVHRVEDDFYIMDNVIEIDSFYDTLYALKGNGDLYIWGKGRSIYDWYEFTTPERIATRVSSFTCMGHDGALIKKTDGTIWHLRGYESEQIYIGDDVVSFTAAKGQLGGHQYAIFLKSDGSIYAFDFETYTPVKVMEGIRGAIGY